MAYDIVPSVNQIRYNTINDLLDALELMVADKETYHGMWQFMHVRSTIQNTGYCTLAVNRPSTKRRFVVERNFTAASELITSKLHSSKKLVFEHFYLRGYVAPLTANECRQYAHTIGGDVGPDTNIRILRLIYWTTETGDILLDPGVRWLTVGPVTLNYLRPAPPTPPAPTLVPFDSTPYLSELFTPVEVALLVKRIAAPAQTE